MFFLLSTYFVSIRCNAEVLTMISIFTAEAKASAQQLDFLRGLYAEPGSKIHVRPNFSVDNQVCIAITLKQWSFKKWNVIL